MASALSQKIYWMAPYIVKCWLASLNARKLDRQRYGSIFQEHLDTIAEHDEWSPEQFAQYQRKQLRSLIQHAKTNVPYYRRIFAETAIEPDCIQELDDLAKLPILEKGPIRANPIAFLDENLDRKNLLLGHTSGTTGTPLDLYSDIWLNSAPFAYAQARRYSVANLQRTVDRSVDIGGHLVTAPKRDRPPFWVYNRRWNQLYMSSYHLSPKYLAYYVDELRKFKPDYIENIPSSIHAIAKFMVDNDLAPIPLKACFTTSETLYDYQREAIKQAFGCRTYDQYGCGEMAVFAAECEHGAMHMSPEFGIVEVVDDNNKPLPIGQSGQLICTSLINKIQPFIRYRIGDIGSLSANKCPCGSLLPVLGSIEGRADDVLITRDGRRIGRLDPVFKGSRGIIEAQIIQDDYDKFRVRVVPSEAYSQDDGREIKKSLQTRVGKATVQIELVDSIERTKRGKFRAVICNLTKK